MGIQISFDTESLTSSDVAALAALTAALGGGETPAPSAPAAAPAPKRGRPKMTDEEKAAAAEKRAEEKAAAEKAAAEKAEQERREKRLAAEAEDEKRELTDLEKAEAEKISKFHDEPNVKIVDVEPKAEETAEEPEPEETKAEEPEEEEESSEDPAESKAEAVRLATQFVHDGRGAEVRNALKEVGAKKISDLDGKTLSGFLAIAREL